MKQSTAGYLVKKRNHWYVVITERDSGTGKRKTRWISTGETDEVKANAFFHRTMHELHEGLYDIDATTVTVKDALQQWLSTKKASVDQNTLSWYTLLVNLHLIPDLGAIKLKDLTSTQLTEYYQSKLKNGSVRQGVGLAPVTVHYLHKIISMALGMAIDRGLLRKNPAADATPPRVPKAEIKYWLPEETRQFLAVAKEKSPNYLFYAVALGTGMRPGEIAALKWRDIDFQSGAIVVQRSLRKPKEGLNREKAPKTKNGWRRVDIPPSLLILLQEHRKNQAKEKAANLDYVDRGLVFAQPNGNYINIEGIRRREFKRMIKEAKVPTITLVGLRHTHATELLMRGMPPLVVSERLGHYAVSFTQERYGHVIPSVQKQAAQLIDDLYTKTTPN